MPFSGSMLVDRCPSEVLGFYILVSVSLKSSLLLYCCSSFSICIASLFAKDWNHMPYFFALDFLKFLPFMASGSASSDL